MKSMKCRRLYVDPSDEETPPLVDSSDDDLPPLVDSSDVSDQSSSDDDHERFFEHLLEVRGFEQYARMLARMQAAMEHGGYQPRAFGHGGA